jgi:putative ABC transport system permease protein
MAEIVSILVALRRNKMGAILIALQIALTLAIVCNASFIAYRQTQYTLRPSGIDEANIASFNNVWIGTPQDLESRLQSDLAALRSVPGVVDAYATDGLPLAGAGFGTSVTRSPQKSSGIDTALYPVDQHALHTLGIRLVLGRWFNEDEIVDWHGQQESPDSAPVIVVTQALAKRLFPGADALGKTVYIDENPMSIIGIVERMQMPKVYGQDEIMENAVLSPYRWAESASLYVLRARPGERDQVLLAAQKKLLQLNRNRVILHVQTFAETRADAYRSLRATALILTLVSALLLLITGLGVVGLTSFWVTQRRRHIGIRRALGARRVDILRYFHVENLLVAAVGTALGLALAIGVNLLLVKHFEMARLPLPFVLGGIFAVTSLGQISVLWPALRAADVPPASAARAS